MRIVIMYGFLGCGKTTLINHLLSHVLDSERVVVLENESGKESVDGDLLRSEGFNVVDLRSGCVCCTLRDDMTKAIDHIESSISPDLLLIEPSGIASLEDLLTIQGIKVDAVVALVDVVRYSMLMKLNGSHFQRQFRLSPIIMMTKIDLMDSQAVENIHKELSQNNPQAVIITDRSELTKGRWNDLLDNHCRKFNAYLFAEKTPVSQFAIESFSVESPQKQTDIYLLFNTLTSMPQKLIRAKGFLDIQDNGSTNTVKVDYTSSGLSFTSLSKTIHTSSKTLTFWWLTKSPENSEEIIREYIR